LADHNFKIALVGAETLLGRELEEVLESRGSGAVLLSYASSGEGNFAEQEGEAVYLEPLTARSLTECRAVLIAGSADGALKTYELAKAAGGHPWVIDCTGYLDQPAEARIVSPLLGETAGPANWLVVLAHPAASALALALKRLRRYKPIRQALAHVFEPASERGKRGINELHQQTTSLLSFRPLDKQVFNAQLSFNLLAQLGDEAPDKLIEVEARIERHLAALLSRNVNGSAIPMPSLRLIQAPVFHGYSISLWTEFEASIEAGELEQALACVQVEVRQKSEEAPHSVGAAGQSGLIAGDIRADRNNARAAWIWLVGDNLRLIADAAADVVAGVGTVVQ
jgi:aspartate-semialdehyde dehydrogenase